MRRRRRSMGGRRGVVRKEAEAASCRPARCASSCARRRPSIPPLPHAISDSRALQSARARLPVSAPCSAPCWRRCSAPRALRLRRPRRAWCGRHAAAGRRLCALGDRAPCDPGVVRRAQRASRPRDRAGRGDPRVRARSSASGACAASARPAFPERHGARARGALDRCLRQRERHCRATRSPGCRAVSTRCCRRCRGISRTGCAPSRSGSPRRVRDGAWPDIT